MAGRTGGGGGSGLRRRRRRRGGLRGGRSFGVGLGLGNGLGRPPGFDRAPGVEEAGRSNGLGGVTDNGRRRLDNLKHPLGLGQDAL